MKTNPEHPHTGIGLTSACNTAASAFLSSSSACDKLMEMALDGSAVKILGQYCFAKDVCDAWTLQCEEEDVLQFQAFEVDGPPQKKILAALVRGREAKNISQGSTRARIFMENLTLTEGKTWLHCRPCKPIRTLIRAPQFTTWMKYYDQVPLFQTGTKCNHPQCA